jgi:hypothetical protein
VPDFVSSNAVPISSGCSGVVLRPVSESERRKDGPEVAVPTKFYMPGPPFKRALLWPFGIFF